MDVDRACSLINNNGIHFMPGWSFEAHPHTKRFDRAILVRANYAVNDTDRKFFPEYDRPIEVYGDFPVLVSDCQEDNTFYFRFFMMVIMRIQFHEAREYFSVRGDVCEKPFHPHTQPGMFDWSSLISEHTPDLARLIGGLDVWADQAFGKG